MQISPRLHAWRRVPHQLLRETDTEVGVVELHLRMGTKAIAKVWNSKTYSNIHVVVA